MSVEKMLVAKMLQKSYLEPAMASLNPEQTLPCLLSASGGLPTISSVFWLGHNSNHCLDCHIAFSQHVSVFTWPSFYKATNHTGIGTHVFLP